MITVNAEVGQPIRFTPSVTGYYRVTVRRTPDGGALQDVGSFADAGKEASVPWVGEVPDDCGAFVTVSLVTAVDAATLVLVSPSPPDPQPPDPETPTLTALSVTPATAALDVGATKQLKATGTYSDGSTADLSSSCTWASSATGKATVSAAGLVTAVAAGAARISAAYQGWTDTADVTVNAVTPPDTGTPYPDSPSDVGWQRTGVQLTPYTGPSVIETAGTVIDGKDITKSIYVRAPNVTIKRSRVKPASGADYAVKQEGNASGFVIEDSEIDGVNGRIDRAILIYDHARISRCYLHGSRRFIYLSGGSYTTVEDCYVSDNVNTTDAHTSAIGSNGGVKHSTIVRNVLQTGKNTNASSALSLYPETNMGGNGDDILIEDNLFNTGGGYGIYLGHTPPEKPHTNLRFRGNYFGTLYYGNCGQYGPCASWSRGGGNVWEDNRWRDQGNGGASKDGQLVPEPSGSTRDGEPIERPPI